MKGFLVEIFRIDYGCVTLRYNAITGRWRDYMFNSFFYSTAHIKLGFVNGELGYKTKTPDQETNFI